jgi:hypothetical protein
MEIIPRSRTGAPSASRGPYEHGGAAHGSAPRERLTRRHIHGSKLGEEPLVADVDRLRAYTGPESLPGDRLHVGS